MRHILMLIGIAVCAYLLVMGFRQVMRERRRSRELYRTQEDEDNE